MLKKTSEAPYTTKVNYRDRTSRGTTRKQAGEVRATPAGTVPCLPPLTLLTSPQPQVRPVLVALEKLVSHETLLSWETTIRTKFDADNAHLLMGRPTGDDAVRAVIRPLPLLYPQPCPHP